MVGDASILTVDPLDSILQKLTCTCEVQFFLYMRTVCLNRFYAQKQLFGNLASTESHANQVKHLKLAVTEIIQRRFGRTAAPYQPRSAICSAGGMAASSRPRIASPRPRETCARMCASL